MVTLDIFADPICPWSYIGKAYLDKALEAAGDHPFVIRWRPFLLNPTMAREGMDQRDYMRGKFGSDQGILEAYQPVVEHAEKAGLEINLPAITRTPNTVDAHRLIHWAGLEERAAFVMTRLMRAYFRDGLDIGAAEVLCDVAEAAGMDPEAVRRLLASDADRREIVEMDASARGMGVNASPTFIVAGQHVVSGAQPPELWAQVMADLAAL